MGGMKNRSFRGLLFLALGLAAILQPATGAPPPDASAKVRAAAYQAQARAVFEARGWTVHHDQPGKLVVEHYAGTNRGPGGTVEISLVDQNANVVGVGQATVTFVPKSATNTDCNAKLVLYFYGQRRGTGGNYPLKGPYPFGNHQAVEAVKAALSKAQTQLRSAHPEYASTAH